MSMQNMQNVSWENRVYNNIKIPFFSEIKLYVVTIIIVYKGSVIPTKTVFLLIIVFFLLMTIS